MLEKLKDRKAWATATAAAVILAVVFFGYLAAVVSPEASTEDLPIAVVNADRGAKVGGERVDLGQQVEKKVTAPGSPLAKTVDWTRLDSRAEAVSGLHEHDYYGAIVIPEDYSGRLSKLAAPQALPQALPQGGEVAPGGPPAPKPARIEILTNPAAGQSASGLAEKISLGAVQKVSRATAERMVQAAQERGESVPPAFAAVLGNPVRADVSPAAKIGPDSAGGGMPFFLSLLGVIAGQIGAALAYDRLAAGEGGSSGSPSAARLANPFPARLILGATFSGLVAALETLVALGLLGVDHSVMSLYVFLWLWLAIGCMMAITLLFLEAFGYAGVALGGLLIFLFGLVASGGLFPLESLPTFYRAYADVLPMRYAVDGMRSLLFYEGRVDASLGKALLVLGTYLVGSVVLAFVVSEARARAEGTRTAPPGGRAPREELLLLGMALAYVSRRVESADGASPGLVRAVSNLAPDEGGRSERERAVAVSRTILKPLSGLLVRGYLLGGHGGIVRGEGGGP